MIERKRPITLSRRELLKLAVISIPAVLIFGCSEGGDKTEQKHTPKPEVTPTVEPEEVAFWSNEDLEPTFERLERSGSREVQLMNPEATLPFYYRRGPLRYFVYSDESARALGTPLMWVFSEPQSRTLTFRNVFIYDDEHYPYPVGARTYDIFGQVIAEAKLLNLEDNEEFEIEEVQYIPNVDPETPLRKVKDFEFYELKGEVSFKARSQFLGGSKIAETVLGGSKNLDYYFMWPTPMSGIIS
jgi:hypothetical protein